MVNLWGGGVRGQVPNPEMAREWPAQKAIVAGYAERMSGLFAGTTFDSERFLTGKMTPVFFGSALTNFGVEHFLRGFLSLCPTPGARLTDAGVLVTSASTDDPRGTVMVYSNPEQDVAVVWVFGLDKD